jgi:hypothetical protein
VALRARGWPTFILDLLLPGLVGLLAEALTGSIVVSALVYAIATFVAFELTFSPVRAHSPGSDSDGKDAA